MRNTEQRRGWMARIGAAVLALALAGCGWIWMDRAPEPGEREEIAPSVGAIPLQPAPAREARRMPGTVVAAPFRPGERVADRGGASVNTGSVGRVTYVYSPDYGSALVSDSPERTFAELAYERGDWHIECGVEGSPYACRLRVASRVRKGGRVEAAMRIRYLPDGPGLIVCAGALDAAGPAIQTGEGAPWRHGAADGCFSREDSARMLDDLARGETFAYEYTSGAFGKVTGWRSTFGLAVGLELMQWMHARRAGG